MLYDLTWLNEGANFPPKSEILRLKDYAQNAKAFDLPDDTDFMDLGNKLIANFDCFFGKQSLLAYQRLSTIKTCDMVVGAAPSITVNDDDEMTDYIQDVRDSVELDDKIYQSLIDYLRYGHTIYRIYNDDLYKETKGNFCIWDPSEWFPIFFNDGTKRIKEHVLAWRVNKGTTDNPLWHLHVQIHPAEGGAYVERTYLMDSNGTHVGKKIEGTIHEFYGYPCLIQIVRNIPSSSNPFGTSDYKIITELIYKATNRMRSILDVLDKHAEPSMTGPVTMLTETDKGEKVFEMQKFYAVSVGEEHPEYLVWEAQLESSFKALEVLLNEIYIFSEMGEAFLGNTKGNGQAVSGTAMRFKMISPLGKARRVANAFILPIKRLMSTLIQMDKGIKLRYQQMSLVFEDSLPKDPRETAELSRLQSGAPAVWPLKRVLMENYDMTSADANKYIEEIEADQEKWSQLRAEPQAGEDGNPAAPVNPNKKGSQSNPGKTGTNSRTNQSD